MTTPAAEPTPELIMETLNAYQRSEALMAAIELDLFSGIAEGQHTTADLASYCNASERGVRMLCDYLVILELLTKSEHVYGLTPATERFLVRGKPTYVGSATRFLGAAPLRRGFTELTAAVRKGGTTVGEEGTLAADHPVWVEFARGMAPLMAPTAESVADLLQKLALEPRRILDIAAGHGLFGISVARRHPGAEVVAVDWPAVLEAAKENADALGIADRFRTLPGSAFEVELGAGYDLALLPNFLHHFDRQACVDLAVRLHDALAPGGRIVAVEHVPNEDRVSPPRSAGFALVMLASTPAGDAYTFAEYREMLTEAGFDGCELHDLEGSLHRVVVAEKER